MIEYLLFLISIHMTPILTEMTLNLHLQLLWNATTGKKERARKRKEKAGKGTVGVGQLEMKVWF